MAACASTQKRSAVLKDVVDIFGVEEQLDTNMVSAKTNQEEFEAIVISPLSARYTLLSPKVDLVRNADRNRPVDQRIINRTGSLGRAMLVGILLLLAGCDRGPAPLPPESLQIRVNLLCSTCDDFLRCEVADVVPETNSYRLHRLREKSFWAQIATIWDYLIQLFRQKTVDVRPLTIYENEGERRRIVSSEAKARVDAAAGLILLPDSIIDMRKGQWRTLNGDLQGQCRTLPRREGYAWVRAMLGRELPVGRVP